MNRRTLPQVARVIAVAAVSVIALTGATVKQIHSPTGPGGPPPFLIAVLADHYTNTQEQEFDYDVENFFKHGLLVDDYYKSQAGNMRIVSYFEATTAGQESAFDFEIGTGVGNCAITAGNNTMTKLQLAVGNTVPTHFIVIGNHPYNFGCTKGRWTYVAVDAVGTDVLQHELGHLIAGLYDEWAMASNGAHPGLTNDRLNCAPTPPPPPHWNAGYVGFQNVPGCDLHPTGVIHPYTMCRMGATHHAKFCEVCKQAMDWRFVEMKTPGLDNSNITGPQGTNPSQQASDEPMARPRFRMINAAFIEQTPPPKPLPVPPIPPVVPRSIVRVLVEFNPDTNAIISKHRTFATGIYLPSYRRLGEFLYEVRDNSGTLEVGVWPDHLFEARGYRGGTQHATGPRQAAEVFVDIPNEDEKSFANPGRRLQVVVYRIPPTVKVQNINRIQFAELMKTNPLTRVAELPLQ